MASPDTPLLTKQQLVAAVRALGEVNNERQVSGSSIGYACAIDAVLEILRGLPDEPACEHDMAYDAKHLVVLCRKCPWKFSVSRAES